MRKKKIKITNNQTNLDYTVKSFNEYTEKSLLSLKMMVIALKDGLIDLNIYNKTLEMIDNVDYKEIIKNLDK